MRILFVSEYYHPRVMGGGEINLHILATALAKRNVSVSVLTSSHPSLPSFEKKDGVRIYRTLTTGETPQGIKHNLVRCTLFPRSVVREVAHLTKKIPFDLIHFLGASVIAAPKLKHLHIPLFATMESYPALCPKGDRIFHGKTECKIKWSFSQFLSCQADSAEIGKMKNTPFLKYNPLALTLIYNHYAKLRHALKYCHIIAISEYVHKVLLQHGVSSTVIPNIINIRSFAIPTPRKQLQNNPPNILYLGSLLRSKGPHLLLRAIQGLHCHCDFYGDGPMKEELQRLIQQKHLNVTIHPPVPYHQVPSLYANADIVVFPSIWPEPFGRIAIEAAAAGKPVIGTRIGGIKETIPDTAGILVSPGNEEELHAAIQQLIENPLVRKKMGMAGKKHAEKYSESNITKQLIQTYSTHSKTKLKVMKMRESASPRTKIRGLN